VQVDDPIHAPDEDRRRQEHEAERGRDGQPFRGAMSPHSPIAPAEPGPGDRSQAVQPEERELPADEFRDGHHEQVFVEESADREDGQDAQDRPSSSPPDRLEDVPLEPSMDPDVIPAPEIEHRAGEDRVAEAIGNAVARQREGRHHQVVGPADQSVDLQRLERAIQPDAPHGQV
jgi:hypothetical protein